MVIFGEHRVNAFIFALTFHRGCRVTSRCRTVSALLQLGASDAGIDLEAVAAAVAIPKPGPPLAPPSPIVAPRENPTTQQSRPLNPAAPPMQMPAVTMEQYTACVRAITTSLACPDTFAGSCSSSGCSGAYMLNSMLPCTHFLRSL